MEICSLVTEKNESVCDSVPLKSISVQVRVQDHVATVSSTLQYVNEEERPLEALFVFPLPADAAVCHFSAKIGEQEIVAEVQDRESARDQYDDAVSSGQQAFLLEESAESPDVFRLSVGCLSAGQNAAVTIIYVTELAVQADHSLRFCLPAVLNPRYTPAGSGAGIVSEISSGCGAVPYTLTLSVHVSSPKPISKLESNCSLDPLVFLHSDHTQATVNLSPGHMFDKDFELFVFYQDTHQPSAIVEAGVTTAPPGSLMRDPVVMMSLYPEFPEEVMSSLATQGEFVFVIDRSGSMGDMMHHGKGAQMRIESAKSVVYNQKTMDQALKKVKEMLSIHRLAARTLIRSLELEERSGAADVEGIRSRMVELSVQAGVSSVHTAFIAVNKDSRQTVKGPLQQRRVPTRDLSLVIAMMQANCAELGTHASQYSACFADEQSFRCSKKKTLRTFTERAFLKMSNWVPEEIQNFFRRGSATATSPSDQTDSESKNDAAPEPQKDPLLQLVSLQKASGCWDLDATLADVFGKTEDELTNQKPAQVDGSVWATLLALIWLYGCKIEQQVEWQFVAMKAASWIGSQKGEISIPDHIICR
ncbi:von Willebrand factor A domain-containing protein 5A-like [Sinocyclocheilus rhinocerous]|uniref:von Willebrand factor A domain-containing protein 5A-like n=1 Tax=Sinocyclocheilus rhinocerous TaxID=307959 RepID=UPI0007B99CBE|nr:PREDICTED: von Willebrand factor A domain-containing protein 5A-like [Sinocyclocheilus rhinocerous]